MWTLDNAALDPEYTRISCPDCGSESVHFRVATDADRDQGICEQCACVTEAEQFIVRPKPPSQVKMQQELDFTKGAA